MLQTILIKTPPPHPRPHFHQFDIMGYLLLIDGRHFRSRIIALKIWKSPKGLNAYASKCTCEEQSQYEVK